MSERDVLTAAYRDFNARNIDAVIALMHPEVEWANGMEGGHVHGKDAVREYWTRQFTMFNPRVDPTSIEPNDNRQWVVTVHQVVHDIKGNLLVDTTVYHTYRFRDGLIARMDIAESSPWLDHPHD
ncbi:nuclear transport factor 2 family protein [Occallatibacter savannae]|uniref:nuclear transport factor 2 family protein n=1 Tax=Occallatibacter savannae TaxID=1002691 RepID=UPI000D69DCEF|nr:nuclear transport factor 2 family protein [Occallatibacter savannae]